MEFHNRYGTPVDPVPFFVVTLLGVLVIFSYGPPYLLELGAPLPHALAVTTVATLCVVVFAYHRYVWTARPEMRALLSPAERLWRLFYGVLIGIALLVLLSLPLFAR